MNEPFLTSISTVASGTPWFSTTMTSSPFGSTPPLDDLFELGALRVGRRGRQGHGGEHDACSQARRSVGSIADDSGDRTILYRAGAFTRRG